MPMKYIGPESYFNFDHNGNRVVVYHCYKNGNADRPLEYHFTTDYDEDERYSFDVRDLGSLELQPSNTGFDDAAQEIIIDAIRSGAVKLPEED